jgi:hypothetical protein
MVSGCHTELRSDSDTSTEAKSSPKTSFISFELQDQRHIGACQFQRDSGVLSIIT